MAEQLSHLALREKLRSLYDTNEAAAAFFDWFNSRGKGSRETKARVAADRTEQAYSKIVDLFRGFEELGLGTFMVGRRGAETRFEWAYDVKSLARIATGETDEPEEISNDTPDDDTEVMLEHSFNLRPGLTITVKLPENFSVREADRLSTWIKSLPFDEQ